MASASSLSEAGMDAVARGGEAVGREVPLLLHRLRVEVVPVTGRARGGGSPHFPPVRERSPPGRPQLWRPLLVALALALGAPLLLLGDDFVQTDIAIRVPLTGRSLPLLSSLPMALSTVIKSGQDDLEVRGKLVPQDPSTEPAVRDSIRK